MNQRLNPPSELEAVFQAARQLEAKLVQERDRSAQARMELEAQLGRQTAELAQTKQYVQKLLAHDQKMRQHLTAVQNHLNSKLQATQQRCAQLEQYGTRVANHLKEKEKQVELDVTAARASVHQLRQKNHEIEVELSKLRPELIRTRDELERVQGDLLERDHRYNASVLSYQDRDRGFATTIEALKDQIKRTQAELGQFKSRWLETERLRQEAEKLRSEAEQSLRRQIPAMIRLKELEEANRSLEKRIQIEKRQREQADAAVTAECQEKEMLESKLRLAQARLERTEAELTKVSTEAALLRAARKSAVRSQTSSHTPGPARPAPAQSPSALRYVDLETIEKHALSGYPVQD